MSYRTSQNLIIHALCTAANYNVPHMENMFQHIFADDNYAVCNPERGLQMLQIVNLHCVAELQQELPSSPDLIHAHKLHPSSQQLCPVQVGKDDTCTSASQADQLQNHVIKKGFQKMIALLQEMQFHHWIQDLQ